MTDDVPTLKFPEFAEEEILGFLKNPHMLDIITDEYHRYHAGDARLLKFLHVTCVARYVVAVWVNVSGSSRGGKDHAVRTVIETFLSTGDTMVALRFTEHGLEYTGEPGQPAILDGKIIYVSEEKGIQSALDTLRPIYGQKGREHTVYSVGVNRKGQKIVVVGCPTLMITAVTPNFDPQTLKRLWLQSVDESPAQTVRAQKLEKYIASHPSEYKQKTRRKRLIEEAVKRYPKEAKVFIPYAEYIQFPSNKVRTRGDLQKFLDFIKCVTYTHMFQRYRVRKEGKITVISDKLDFEIGRDILTEIFGASLSDIPNAVQKFYLRIKPVLNSVGEKTGDGEILYQDGLKVKDIVKYTGLSDPTVRRYMDILINAGKVAKSYAGKHVCYFPTQSNSSNAQMNELVNVDWERNKFSIQIRSTQELNSMKPCTLIKPDGVEVKIA